jgi:hypothetical protein
VPRAPIGIHLARAIHAVMSTDQPKAARADDLDAVRTVADALKPFEPKDQERIIRWVREKLGLASSSDHAAAHHTPPAPSGPTEQREPPRDIRSFINSKDPQSDMQFAAAVAYYYRFEASEQERKLDISAEDLQEAARRVGRDRLNNPGQTLRNAHNHGYFDKADRGRFALNTVGENLVAMALPQTTAAPARRAPKGRRGGRKKSRD